MRTLEAIRDYFRDLFAGDPVALTFTGIILAVLAFLLLLWWRAARKLRKEDEQRKRKWYRKDR